MDFGVSGLLVQIEEFFPDLLVISHGFREAGFIWNGCLGLLVGAYLLPASLQVNVPGRMHTFSELLESPFCSREDFLQQICYDD